MADFTTSYAVNLAGNLARRGREFVRSNNRMSKSFKTMRRTAALAGRGLDKMGNRYTALLTGAGAVGTLRTLFSLEDRMTRLGIQANASGEDMDKLKRQIFDIARMPNIRIDPNEALAAIEEIVEKTGNKAFATDNLENLAMAISATGAAGKDVGSISAEFEKMGVVLKNEVRESIDLLTAQGKAGAFTFKNLATLGSRVVTAYTAMGRTGIPALREMGAVLQVIRQGTGNSEQAATAFEAMLRTLTDPAKLKLLKAGGIKVFDEDAMKAGKEIMRPLNEIMEDIVRKTKGSKVLLAQVFDAEAMRAFNAASSEFKRTGKVELFKKFMDVQADGTEIMADSARAAKTASRNLGALLTSWKRFADGNLAQPIKDLTALLDKLDPETFDKVLKTMAIAGGGLGAAVIGRRVFKAFGGGKGGLAKAALSGKFGGAQPVYVVNLPGTAGGLADGATGTKGRGLFRKGLAVTGAGAVGFAVGSAISKAFVEGTTFSDNLGRTIAHTLAGLGIKNAQESLNIERGAAKVQIEIVGDQRVRVRKIESHGIDLDVDSGLILLGP